MANPWDIVDEQPAGSAGATDWTPVAEKPVLPFTPRDMTLGEGTVHAGGQFMRGMNQQLGDWATGLSKFGTVISPAYPIGKVSEYFGGPNAHDVIDMAHNAYNKFLDVNAPPETKGAYVARGAGEMVGNTLPMSLALITGGTMATPQWLNAPVSVGNPLRMAGDTVLKSVANAPISAAMVDAVSAAGAGAGGNIADIESGKPRADPLPRSAAEIGGATVPLAWYMFSPTALAARAGKEAVDYVRGKPGPVVEGVTSKVAGMRDTAKAKALDSVAAGVTERLQEPTIAGNVESAAAVADQIPGFKPTLAQRSGVPSLVRAQEGIESRATGDELNRVADIRGQNQAAIDKFVKESAPAGPQVGNPEDVFGNAMEKRLAAIEQRLGIQSEKPASEIAMAEATMPTTAPKGPADRTFDPQRAGETIREQSAVERGKMDAQVASRRAAIDPNSTTAINPDTIRGATKGDALRSAFGPEVNDPIVARMLGAEPKPVESGLVDEFGKPIPPTKQASEPATLTDTMDFASKLNAVQRRLLGNPQRTPQQDEQLTSVKRALDATNAEIERAVAATGDKDMAQRLADYRQFYKTEYVPRFQQGAMADARAKAPAGEFKVNSEDLPKKFFNPNSLTEAEQFQKVFGQNPRAQEVMTDHALASLRDSLGGKPLTQAAIDAWKAKHARVLDRMPEVRAAVDKIDVSEAEKRLATLDSRRRAVAESEMGQILSRDVATAIPRAVQDPKVMRQMAATARRAGPDAEAAFKKLVWDHALGKDGVPDVKRLDAILGENERSLNIALGPKHVADLRTITEAARIQGRTKPPVGSTDTEALSPPDKFKEATGSGFNQLLNRFITVARGRSSATYESGAAAGQFIKNLSEKQHEQLLKEVLYDGRLANDFATFLRTGQRPPKERARAYLLAIGASSVDGDGGKRENP